MSRSSTALAPETGENLRSLGIDPERLLIAGPSAGLRAHTELHMSPGGFHAFDLVAPHAELAKAMTTTRNAWVARTLRH